MGVRVLRCGPLHVVRQLSLQRVNQGLTGRCLGGHGPQYVPVRRSKNMHCALWQAVCRSVSPARRSPSTNGDSSPRLHMPGVAQLDTASTVASQTQSRTVLLADSLATAIPRRSQEVACFSRAEQIHMMQARDERDQVEGVAGRRRRCRTRPSIPVTDRGTGASRCARRPSPQPTVPMRTRTLRRWVRQRSRRSARRHFSWNRRPHSASSRVWSNSPVCQSFPGNWLNCPLRSPPVWLFRFPA